MKEVPQLPPDGERLTTGFCGQIVHEHLHRYTVARQYVVNKDVIDIACGEGYGSDFLSRAAKSVVGVDISELAITRAKSKYTRSNLGFKFGSCTSIPLPDKCMDVAVSFETLEHFSEHEIFINELKRVLRPGGLLIISSPDKKNYSDRPNYKNPFHLRELYHEEFKRLIRGNFRETVFAKQVYYPGSIIELESATQILHIKGDYATAKYSLLQEEAVYSISFASDFNLPKIESSLYQAQICHDESKVFSIQLFTSSCFGFVEENSIRVLSHSEQRTQVAFNNISNHLSAGLIHLRLDPADLAGVIEIHEARLTIGRLGEETKSIILPQPERLINLCPLSTSSLKYFSATTDPQIYFPPIEWDGLGTVSVTIDLTLSSDLTNIATFLIQQELDIARGNSSIDSLNNTLGLRESSIANLQNEQRHARHKILCMQNSFSWKITAPLRAIHRLIRH